MAKYASRRRGLLLIWLWLCTAMGAGGGAAWLWHGFQSWPLACTGAVAGAAVGFGVGRVGPMAILLLQAW